MAEQHIHGWRKYGLAKSEKYMCCSSPNCFVVRDWKFIIGRFAKCPNCFETFIVLGYQRKGKILKCHTCMEHQLTENEHFLIQRLTEESERQESVVIRAPSDLAKEIVEHILNTPINQSIARNFVDRQAVVDSGEKINLDDLTPQINVVVETMLTPEQESELKESVEKTIRKLAEGEMN